MSTPQPHDDSAMDGVSDASALVPTSGGGGGGGPSASTSNGGGGPAPSSAVASGSGVMRGADGAMYLRWEPGMTTTTTTHTTQTITHFPPVRLPHPTSLLPPASLPLLPTHLSPTRYPLSTTPTPEDLRFFALSLGGKKVIFREEGTTDAEEAEAEKASREGRGWVRCGEFDGSWGDGTVRRERVGIVEALGGAGGAGRGEKRDRGKGKEREDAVGSIEDGGASAAGGGMSNTTSMVVALSPPPASAGGSGLNLHRSDQDLNSSPPRKRLRDESNGLPTPHPTTNSFADLHQSPSDGRSRSFSSSTSPTLHNSRQGLPISLSSSSAAAFGFPPPPPTSTSTSTTTTISASQPSTGSGQELAMLYSLPSLLSTFDNLPTKLKEHFLMHCFRRSELSTIQRLSSFISPALKFDFVTHFPTEISIAIFTFVPRAGLASAARVSKKWNAMVDSQRGIWVGRMKEDGLWWGYGAEEEEEELVRKRWEVKDRMDKKAKRAAEFPLGTPVEAARATLDGGWERSRGWSVGSGGNGGDDGRRIRSHPLKQVYRMRQQSAVNWARPRPSGGRHMFNGHGAHVVTCLQFDTDKIVSASDDHSINIYDIKDGQLRCRLDGHEGGVWALQYKGDVLVSGSTDRTVRIWSIEKQEQTHVFHGHTSTVRCLQIVDPVRQPNGEFLPPYPLIVTGSRDSNIRVWKLPSKGEPEYRSPAGPKVTNPHRPKKDDDPVLPHENPFHNHCLEGHTNAVRAIAAYGQYCVSGSYDCTVRVWDIVKGTCLHVLRGHQQKVYSVVLDARRNRVASGSMDGTVKVWDLLHGTCLQTLEGHGSLVGLLCISPNNLVSAAADSTIKIWDATTLACKHTLTAHQGAITCFQHDEMKIISGSEGTLKMWDIRDGSFVRDLVTGVQGVWQVAFSGRHLVSASNRGGMTVFDVIDFGDCGYDDGAGDESLDEFIIPDWERENRLEPRTYQQSNDYPMYQADFHDTYTPSVTLQRQQYGQPFVNIAPTASTSSSSFAVVDDHDPQRTPVNQHATVPPTNPNVSTDVPTSFSITQGTPSKEASSSAPSSSNNAVASGSGSTSYSARAPPPRPPSKFEASSSTGAPSTSWNSRSTWGPEAYAAKKKEEERRAIMSRSEADRVGPGSGSTTKPTRGAGMDPWEADHDDDGSFDQAAEMRQGGGGAGGGAGAGPSSSTAMEEDD